MFNIILTKILSEYFKELNNKSFGNYIYKKWTKMKIEKIGLDQIYSWR